MVTTEDWLSAQVAVLGSVLLDEQWAGEVVSRTSPEDYGDVYRPVYLAIRSKFNAGETIDPVTIRAALGDGTRDLLLQIMQVTPTAANCAEYIDLMLEQSRLNRLRALGEQLMQAANLEDALQTLSLANAQACAKPKVRVVTMTDALHDFYERQRAPKPDYLPWGIEALDERLYTEAGDFVILGGYPSDGKTSLALAMAWHQAKTRRVGFFSFETRDSKLFDRLIPTVTKVDFGRVKRHGLTDDDWDVVAGKSSEITANRLELIPATGLAVDDLRALALSRRYAVLYVDYLQLVRADNQRQTLYEQVTQVSKSLHGLAQSTGITVVALSQLTRPESSGKGGWNGGTTVVKAPGIHSLRQSGQIEQDADAIMFVYREDSSDASSRRMLKLAKNKEGLCFKEYPLLFDGSTQSFRPDRNDQAVWRKPQAQVSMREMSEDTPVPF